MLQTLWIIWIDRLKLISVLVLSVISYSGNKDLHKESKGFNHVVIIVFSVLGACLLLMVVLICCLFVRKSKKNVSEGTLGVICHNFRLCSIRLGRVRERITKLHIESSIILLLGKLTSKMVSII